MMHKNYETTSKYKMNIQKMHGGGTFDADNSGFVLAIMQNYILLLCPCSTTSTARKLC